MKVKKVIKVLVVDDSLFFREMLVRGLSEDESIKVVDTASNPYEARDKIIQHRPDVMTLDIQMPRMNGVDFLKKLLPQYAMPIVIVSSASDRIFEALNIGAVEYVAKPDIRNTSSYKSLINELIIKIKIACISKIKKVKKINKINANKKRKKVLNKQNNEKIIAIGASTGGTKAIFTVINSFPRDIPGIVIVQHMPATFTQMYAQRLNSTCIIDVKEAKDGDEIMRGRALIAPALSHMKVRKKGSKYIVRCYKGRKVNGFCPSVDVLFNSLAEEVGNNAIGIILTGMGYDGAKGLLNMRKKGAITIGQDEKSSVVYGMPRVAYNIGAVKNQFSLYKISQKVLKILNE